MNSVHRAKKRERRLRSLRTRLEALESERNALLKTNNINLRHKHHLDQQIAAVRTQFKKSHDHALS